MSVYGWSYHCFGVLWGAHNDSALEYLMFRIDAVAVELGPGLEECHNISFNFYFLVCELALDSVYYDVLAHSLKPYFSHRRILHKQE